MYPGGQLPGTLIFSSTWVAEQGVKHVWTVEADAEYTGPHVFRCCLNTAEFSNYDTVFALQQSKNYDSVRVDLPRVTGVTPVFMDKFTGKGNQPTSEWNGRWPLTPGQPFSEWWPGFWICWLPAEKLWIEVSEEASAWTGSDPPPDPAPLSWTALQTLPHLDPERQMEVVFYKHWEGLKGHFQTWLLPCRLHLSPQNVQFSVCYLQDRLVVDIVKDCSVDLTWLQSDPVQHWHPELSLDWFLYFHRWMTQING